MVTRRDEWLQARGRARARRPRPSIESCWLEEQPDGTHQLVVHGDGLSGLGGIPTLVSVGGRPVRHVDASDPNRLRGMVTDGRIGDEVVVDLGPAGRLTGEVEPAP